MPAHSINGLKVRRANAEMFPKYRITSSANARSGIRGKFENSHNLKIIRRYGAFQLPPMPRRLGEFSLAMGRSVEKGRRHESQPSNLKKGDS